MRFESARKSSVESSRTRSEGARCRWCWGRLSVERGFRGEAERERGGWGAGMFSLGRSFVVVVVEMCFKEEVRMGVMGIRARDFNCVWRLMSFFSKSGMREVSFSYTY